MLSSLHTFGIDYMCFLTFILCLLDVPAVFRHNSVNDFLRKGLLVYFEIEQKFAFHGVSFLPLRFYYGGRIPYG